MLYSTVVLLLVYTQLFADILGINPKCALHCPHWIGYRNTKVIHLGKCLYWSRTRKTFAEAQSHCEAKRGRMFAAKGSYFFFIVLEQAIENRRSYWIGLDDRKREGELTWHDNTKYLQGEPKYHNLEHGSVNLRRWNFRKFWLRGQPDNANGRQHCVVVTHDHRRLDDDYCEVKRHYVCELRN